MMTKQSGSATATASRESPSEKTPPPPRPARPRRTMTPHVEPSKPGSHSQEVPSAEHRPAFSQYTPGPEHRVTGIFSQLGPAVMAGQSQCTSDDVLV